LISPAGTLGQLERLDHAGRHAPRSVGGDAVRAPLLVGGVGGPVGVEFLLQAPAGLKEPLGAVAGDRAPFALALRFQRASALAQPRPATLRARHELLQIKLDLNPIIVLVIVGIDGRVALAAAALLRLAQRLAPALPGPQLLG
jgi:hypothetical protein